MEIKNMQKKATNSRLSRIVTQLKNLPDDDRVILSLFLYEGLSSQQVQKVLHQNGTGTLKSRRDLKNFRHKKLKTI
jgi:DNA-directed RNA polymerase specialized sigma24 family protein